MYPPVDGDKILRQININIRHRSQVTGYRSGQRMMQIKRCAGQHGI